MLGTAQYKKEGTVPGENFFTKLESIHMTWMKNQNQVQLRFVMPAAVKQQKDKDITEGLVMYFSRVQFPSLS